MKKFEIINNSLVVTDTVTNKILFDNPKSEIYYNSAFLFLIPNEIRIVDLSSKYNNSIIFSCLLSEAVNSLSVAFTQETFIDFARRNLGFKTASGGSGAIVYFSENYNALILEDTAYLKVGDLAYIYNSQGTSWLPGTIGGTYYPSGFYFWNGTNWESDRNAIATQFNTNIIDIVNLQNNKQDNLVSGTNIKTLEGQSLLGSGNIDLTKSDVGLSNVQNTDTTTTANITDSVNKRFVLDAQITNINNQSGTNTGDETTLSIQTKRPLKTIENQSLEGFGNIDLTKTDVGLANVDNTSDLNKPISTATQTALDLKQNALTNPITGTGTSGQVAFFNGATTQQGKDNLFFDNTNNRLGVNNNNPAVTLDVSGPVRSRTGIIDLGTSSNNQIWQTSNNLNFKTNGTEKAIILANGNFGIGTLTPSQIIGLGGETARTIKVENRTVAGAGNSLTIEAGGGNGTNQAGGNLILSGGPGTGTGQTSIEFRVTGGGVSGTTLATPTTVMRISPFGLIGLGIGTATPSHNISLNGNANTSIGKNRHTTADTAGTDMNIWAGGATSGATNKNGGTLVLNSGTATGSGSSNIEFRTSTPGASGTTDANPNTKMTLLGNGNLGIGTTPTNILDINGNSFRLRTARTITNATDVGSTGEICWDTNYIYVCVATNTWKRTALTTW